ncbi:MAG: hypothetical protein OEQ49_13345 [Myxococcales bacterium]|nr:hypothetical protein [Myxococcales bacterium]
MNDVFSILLVTSVGGVLVAASSMGFSRREQRWVAVSFFLHVGFACVQVPLTLSFYGGGDMFLYFSYGEILAQMMERDPLHIIPEVTALLLHNRPHLPLDIIGAGTGTGTMSALAAWAFYLLGPSKYAACIAFAMLSLCGKVAIYRVFRANLDATFRWPLAIAALFVPSFVFWSSGLIKEALAVAGFGWSFLGLHLWIREGRAAPGWALTMAGTIPILLIKPYILFPLVLAGGSWYYWARSLKRGRVRIQPAYLAVAAVLGIGGIIVLEYYFPEYALDTFAARTSDLQQLGRRGGSAYVLGGGTPTTLVGQFAYAPAALLTSLFRPVLFEVHNLLTLVNAVETTVLTLLFARILVTRNLGNVRRQIADSPLLVFCVVFVIAFGIAVGFASSNLGTLSRYRSLLLPFFVALLLVLGKPLRARSPARTLRRAPKPVLDAA